MSRQQRSETDESHHERVNQLLLDLPGGDREAFNELLPLVYHELHFIAAQHRRRWSGDETLNTTALVHEAYLRLAGASTPAWRGYPHFMAVASRAMRHVLLDYAKQRQRAKRGGAFAHVSLRDVETALNAGDQMSDAHADALFALDEALRRLEQHDARQSRIVECRFFGGMSIEATAAALGISPATVKRAWVMAQAWLHRELSMLFEATS